MSTDSLAVQMPGFAGPSLSPWLDAALRDGLGGVCLFATNVLSAAQLRDLTDAIYAANPIAVIAIDEEGGDVSRLHHAEGSPFPGNALLGRIDDVGLTYAVGAAVGGELAGCGVGLDLAPDADVNSNPLNPVIGVRSFGADQAVVARHTAAWVAGLQSTGLAACAKHFPGHGDTAQDSHLALPVVDAPLDTLRERDLAPFVAAIDAGVATIMTSHIVVPALDPDRPATFSPAILRDLLRDELGFGGVIVTDALDMVGASGDIGIPAAAARAIDAGADLLCIGTDNSDEQVRAIAAAVEGADRERLADAATRVRRLGTRLRDRRARDEVAPCRDLPTPERIATAFRVDRAAVQAIAAHRRTGAPVAWVELASPHNIAVGDTEWGPFAAPGGPRRAAVVDSPESCAEMLAGLPAAAAVVLVGRDLARIPWAPSTVEAVRRERRAAVVDMGWPAAAHGVSDVDTFGASRLAGAALLTIGW